MKALTSDLMAFEVSEHRTCRSCRSWSRTPEQHGLTYIINEKRHEEKKHMFNDECERIVMSAAKLVKAQVREAKYSLDEYPTASEVSDRQCASNWLPSLLPLFLSHLIPTELKRISLGHTLVQAARPKSALSPVLFGLVVSLDHEFGFKITECYVQAWFIGVI